MTALPIVLMTEEEVANFGRTGDACFGALRTARGLLPLTAMDVDVRVAGAIAATEVAQTYVNTTGVAIEATYIFPLPDRAAVHRFRMEVAGRVIDGVVEERGEAREQYDRAIATGHRAAITEQERPGVFTLRVGNLMPGEAATVRLSIVGPLPIDDGEVTFRFPLVVAPRYMPGYGLPGEQAGLGTAIDTHLVPDASRISPPVLLPGCPNPVRLGLRVAIRDRGLHDVASSLHAVASSLRDAQVIEVHPGERLDRDFILRWRIDGAELASSLICADDPDGRAGTFMLTVVPPSSTAVAAKPRDVVFVLDRSGSMEGWKMVAARRALARMIDTLSSRDRFHVIAFDNAVEVLPDVRPVAATDRNRFVAIEALAKIDARGGTELAVPLQLAVKLLAGGHDDRSRVVVLVTDGQVGNEDHILREIAPSLRNVRVFTLGIDQAVNEGFLKRLASAGGGLCELVESEDRLDAVMAKVHRRIGTPLATELVVSSRELDLDRATIAPKRLPDVYAGSPVVVLGRYRGRAPDRAALDVEGTSMGDPMKWSIVRAPEPDLRVPVPVEAPAAPGWLAASWARGHIRELEDRYAIGAHEVEPEIVAVSKRFCVLSRFTAFLAIDRSQIVNPGGHVDQIVQAVETPDGWADKERGESGGGGQARSRRTAGSTPVMARRAPMIGAAQSFAAMPRSGPNAGASPARPGASAPAPMMPPAPPAGPSFRAQPPRPAPRDAIDTVSEMSANISDDFEEGPSQVLESPPPAEYKAMPPPSGYPQQPPMAQAKKAKAEAAPSGATAYLIALATLARDLAQQASGRADHAAIRLLRQRLTEWIEDVRSVGGHELLAATVERLIQRLSAALASGENVAAEASEVARELAKLAGGTTPPPAQRSRLAFWK